MSNTVITNYTDLNGPSTKADSSVVVIVNKDGSLSVDQNLLGTLMGTDGSQAAGISVVRVGHEGKPDDATDSESDDDKVPHVTLSVDSYYDEPNSIIKYDSGAEMLQSLRIETRENSLVGFQNDHCYTPFTSPSQNLPQSSDRYDDPVIEITHTPPPKPVPNSKKITILEQQIIPKGKKIILNPPESPIILKGNDVLNKPLPVLSKTKNVKEQEKGDTLQKTDESSSSSSSISSGDSIPDRDSDSDYKETKDRSASLKVKKTKLKPRILKNVTPKSAKLDPKVAARLKSNKNILKKEVREKIQIKPTIEKRVQNVNVDLESLIPSSEISLNMTATPDHSKNVVTKHTPKPAKKEKKTPAHVTALLSDMTSLFSTPDVIRRVSTDNKVQAKDPTTDKKNVSNLKTMESNTNEFKSTESILKVLEDNSEKPKPSVAHKTYIKQKEKTTGPIDKISKGYDLSSPIPQLDDASLAQILQDTSGIAHPMKMQPGITTGNSMASPGLAGPLSPTLDLLGGLQPEEEGLTEDLLMHVAQLVESSENLQEVIDKQVLGKVDTTPVKVPVQSPFQQAPSLYAQTLTKSAKSVATRKDPIEIVRRDGRVITLPPIEAPATRSSKRKSQMETSSSADVIPTPVSVPSPPVVTTPEPQVQAVSKQYVNKKLSNKKQEQVVQAPVDKMSAESQESWNSEDDPYRLWCICRQPHNNRFMICCDGCEDWFHGKCVNITKAMGQAMEEQGIEWRCPNCIKKTPKTAANTTPKVATIQKKNETDVISTSSSVVKEATLKTNCIVCKKHARASSIYCSDACILKHAQDSLSPPPNKSESNSGKTQGKNKAESRVIVFERKSGKLLAGPNAPTAENLKAWLQKNPTFEVVRPGSLSPIRPTITKKKVSNEPNKIQTTLNFERVPKKSIEQPSSSKSLLETKSRVQQQESKLRAQSDARPKAQHMELKSRSLQQERIMKTVASPREELKQSPQPRTPVALKQQQTQYIDTPRPSTSTAKPSMSEPRRLVRTSSRSQVSSEKVPAVSPSTSRRKDSLDSKNKMVDSSDSIRDNVKKALQEQMSLRMAENTGPKFSEDEIMDFANETELELHELFRDVGMKYKAKYRSLMFNIKDRKNLSLWQKICDRTITPKQLVRLSPEELASQELAQWREEEAKHQLELIKKSELDLLAASKTYVLKTHKGEEVMETKESVSTELDPNVPIEDVVTALNEETAGEESKTDDTSQELNTTSSKGDSAEKKHSRKRGRDDSFEYSKKDRRDSKRDSDSRKSRSSRRKSEMKEKDSRESRRSTRRSDKRSSRAKSESREDSKEKTEIGERSRHRSRSRAKSKRRSKSRERSRSVSRRRERSRSGSRRREPPRTRARRTSADDKPVHRSRSQENCTKTKHDSTDSDSVERPKSAMLKEVHPEYDPHEPMITSAFSEEDLRKSREDVYEDTYKDEVEEYDNKDYDASKSFSIDAAVINSESKYVRRKDKVSEAESDQEPSSTVDNSAATVWNGCINMVDVARFYVAAHEVSGTAADLEEDLSAELDIVGRINPDTVWDYIGKMKRASNKDIVVLRLQAANDEEKMQYIALYSYLSSRNRLGVVKVSNTTSVKDFYIVPLPANTALPAVLLPLDGPGLGDAKTHLLIAIVIRQRKRRLLQHIQQEIVPAKVARESRKRSYTPPLGGRGAQSPASPRRRPPALPLPAYTSPALSTSVKDKIAASLASADDDEAYSPGSSSSSGSAPASALSQPASNTLRTKMEELNRQIEEQKQQILKMARADSSVGEQDEAYSPSRPMTPPAVPLSDIALPSNLQEILATIKQRSEPPPADVDMRSLPLP
ncbi:death-inducer obliterator 1 isoform X1 [Ostrinia nubilalis]|uniref:death-inducer obliterator 1 isoform X1 n=1 Tax=Ostrinia nubilalis TaxID=29057 RepID=UPI0030825091